MKSLIIFLVLQSFFANGYNTAHTPFDQSRMHGSNFHRSTMQQSFQQPPMMQQQPFMAPTPPVMHTKQPRMMVPPPIMPQQQQPIMMAPPPIMPQQQQPIMMAPPVMHTKQPRMMAPPPIMPQQQQPIMMAPPPIMPQQTQKLHQRPQSSPPSPPPPTTRIDSPPKSQTTPSGLFKFCSFEKPINCDTQSVYRTLDGSCNNLRKPWWGKSETPFKRWIEPAYADGMNEPRVSVTGEELPNPRDIACALNSDAYEIEPEITHMMMQWGQFVNHDLTSLAIARDEEAEVTVCNKCERTEKCMPIQIRTKNQCNCVERMKHECIEFARATYAFPDEQCQSNVRENLNMQTSFIDASHVYGTDADTLSKIRNKAVGKGMLFLQPGLDILPADTTPQPADCLEFTNETRCFIAGDNRVNQNFALMSMHTLFVREHNRFAQILASLNPSWDDETVFEEARRIIIALEQHITYNEYVPLLLSKASRERNGLSVGTQFKYDENVDPRMSNEWAAAIGRFGHSMIRSDYSRVDQDYKRTFSSLKLQNGYFRAHSIYDQCQGGLESIVRGLLRDPLMKVDQWFAQDLTQHLFETTNELGVPFHFDLVSINIQRGRDVGIPSYKALRKFCNLPELSTWTALKTVIPSETVEMFKKLYKFVDDLDVFTASVAETKADGAIVGPTLDCLLALQFRDAKFGDRFFYETQEFPNNFTPEQLNSIKQMTLSKILCTSMKNTPKIQPFAFLSSTLENNKLVSCDSLPDIDWRHWKV